MKKTYRVYFSDGNQRMFEASNMLECIKYIEAMEWLKGHSIIDQIIKVEEVEVE